jgi:GTP-binding protein
MKTGVADADRDVAEILRKSRKPVILAVNKVDVPSRPNHEIFEFY